jgi:hypothetical protein
MNDEEIRFVLDQHAELDFYNASSLRQVLRKFSGFPWSMEYHHHILPSYCKLSEIYNKINRSSFSHRVEIMSPLVLDAKLFTK